MGNTTSIKKKGRFRYHSEPRDYRYTFNMPSRLNKLLMKEADKRNIFVTDIINELLEQHFKGAK